MPSPAVNASVRLLQDLPQHGLRSGEVGIVCSTWFAPARAYEVEFQPARGPATRALVTEDRIQPAVAVADDDDDDDDDAAEASNN